jgi:transcription elongation factor Elf1
MAWLYEGTRDGVQGSGRYNDDCARCYGGKLRTTLTIKRLGRTVLVCDVCGRRYDWET